MARRGGYIGDIMNDVCPTWCPYKCIDAWKEGKCLIHKTGEIYGTGKRVNILGQNIYLPSGTEVYRVYYQGKYRLLSNIVNIV